MATAKAKTKAAPKRKTIPKIGVQTEIEIEKLKPHPQNYREHSEDQLDHIAESIRLNGVYRNVVVSKDLTILAGHGVVKAATRMGMKTIPVVRVPLKATDPKALKLLIGDNEIGKLAGVDDRALTNLLKEIKESGEADLAGTGFDDRMFAALVMVTRPAEEIADFDAAAEWTGMPKHEPGTQAYRMIIQFANADDRHAFLKHAGFSTDDLAAYTDGMVWSTWWPKKERNDLDSVKFEGADDGKKTKDPS